MGRTELKSHQIHDGSIQNIDIDITTPGKALITKIVAGTGVSINSTGVDDGTGVVTISSTSTSTHQYEQIVFNQTIP